MELSFGGRPRAPDVSAPDRVRLAARAARVSAVGFLVSAAMLATAAMSVAPPVTVGREVVATEAQRGGTVRLRPGDRLRLTLPSNGTTGFSWTVARMPPQLRRVADRMEAPAVPPGLVGAEGRQILIFEAARPGSGVLRLRYRQPWAGGMTGDLFLLRIESGR